MPQLPSASSPAEALACFDGLPPVACEDLLGEWTGQSFPSGHPLDGALEQLGWIGKRFDGVEHVHPLVFRGWNGAPVHLAPPLLLPGVPLLLRWPALKRTPLLRLARRLLPLLRARGSRGRLRLLRHRGVVTAALVYDDVPILDAFRRLDAQHLLGCMDLKGMAQPFFFVLRRADVTPASG